MRSLVIVVMHELFKPLVGARPTANPRVMETVDPHLERVKPLFDEVSVGIVNPTVQSSSGKGSPIAELIDGKHGLGEIVFLAEPMEKCRCWIGALPPEQLHVKNQLCVEVYCSVQPRPLAVDLDSGLVNRDP